MANDNTASSVDVSRWMDAALRGNIPQLKALLDHGIDIESRDFLGYTALMTAASGGQAETVKFLLEQGADPNARSDQGITALMWALMRGYTNVARLLLDNGADAAAVADNGQTAEKIAWKKHRDDMLPLLRQAVQRQQQAAADAAAAQEGAKAQSLREAITARQKRMKEAHPRRAQPRRVDRD